MSFNFTSDLQNFFLSFARIFLSVSRVPNYSPTELLWRWCSDEARGQLDWKRTEKVCFYILTLDFCSAKPTFEFFYHLNFLKTSFNSFEIYFRWCKEFPSFYEIGYINSQRWLAWMIETLIHAETKLKLIFCCLEWRGTPKRPSELHIKIYFIFFLYSFSTSAEYYKFSFFSIKIVRLKILTSVFKVSNYIIIIIIHIRSSSCSFSTPVSIGGFSLVSE